MDEERHGIINYPKTGMKYTGQIKNGKENGRGIAIWTDGKMYDGQWKNGEKWGDGILTWNLGYKHGETYNGTFKHNIIHGWGTYTYANGTQVSGTWINGKLEKGTLIKTDGSHYEGQFKNEYLDGVGKMTYANGDIYYGHWDKGKPDGNGTMTYANGDIYYGHWDKGKPNGNGKLTKTNGNTYICSFKSGEINGQGTLIFKNNKLCISNYVGRFKNYLMHRWGTMTWENGLQYVGRFENNTISGRGKWTFGNLIHRGHWSHNNQLISIIFTGNLLGDNDHCDLILSRIKIPRYFGYYDYFRINFLNFNRYDLQWETRKVLVCVNSYFAKKGLDVANIFNKEYSCNYIQELKKIDHHFEERSWVLKRESLIGYRYNDLDIGPTIRMFQHDLSV